MDIDKRFIKKYTDVLKIENQLTSELKLINCILDLFISCFYYLLLFNQNPER